MKTKYIYIVIIALLTGTFVGCSDWTEPTGKNFFETPSDEYYANLRAYKNTDHQKAFGWFGGWTGKGASMVSSLMGLPDSVDFVSIWGNWKSITPEQEEDLRLCQTIKGTKFLLCFIVHDLGDQLTPQGESAVEYWGWEGEWVPDRKFVAFSPIDMEVTPKQEEIIRKYARQIADTVAKYNYDGFDIDYEPNYQDRWGSLASYPKRMSIFMEEIGKFFGPQSGTGKLLVVDGEPQAVPTERGPLFDYFIVQAYGSPGYTDLDARLQKTINNFDGVLTPEEVAKKYIVTENFEKYAQTGGSDFTDRFGNKMKSLAGMAGWNPIVNDKMVSKGGCGTYHMEYDYINQDACHQEYKFLRQAISIMNPTIK